MHKVNVFFHPYLMKAVKNEESQNKQYKKNSIVVVIDVLRATTSIIRALESGVKKIIPAATVKDAFRIKKIHNDSPETMVCGERKGVRVDGFDLGNSPEEFKGGDLESKILIFTTTNGTQAFKKVSDYPKVIAASFINISAVIKFILKHQEMYKRIIFLCSGTDGFFTLEDTACAGMIINKIMNSYDESPEITDAAIAARDIYITYEDDLMKLLERSRGGRNLIEIGLYKDLKEVAMVNTSSVVPIYSKGEIMRSSTAE